MFVVCVCVKSSNYEDDQVRKTVGKTLEEITQERAADGENELVFIQVSPWEQLLGPI